MDYTYRAHYNRFRAMDAMEFTRRYDVVMEQMHRARLDLPNHPEEAIQQKAVDFARKKIDDLNERIDRIVRDDPEKLPSTLLAALRGYETAIISIRATDRTFQFPEVMLWQDDKAYTDLRIAYVTQDEYDRVRQQRDALRSRLIELFSHTRNAVETLNRVQDQTSKTMREIDQP